MGRSSPGYVADAIERAAISLSSELVPDELGKGSHIINVILKFDDDDDDSSSSAGATEAFTTLECPRKELRLYLEEENTSNDDDFADADECCGAELRVQVKSIAAGSESEYLPEAYRPLYEDASLRNPLYANFKKRRREETAKLKQQQQQPNNNNNMYGDGEFQ